MTGILNALIAGVSGAVKDAYFNLVSLLLPGNGTNGAQNNTFLDSSTNNFTITRNGNTTQGTFSPFSQTGWGNYFNGSSNLQLSSNADFQPGTGNFTIEAWVNFSANNSMIVAVFNQGCAFYVKSTGFLAFAQDSVAERLVASTAFPLNQWNHVAVVRSSTTLTIYQNGVSVGSVSNSDNLTGTTVTVGSGNALSQGSTGYISNFRFVKNQALFTGAFTPAIAPINSTAVGSTGAGVPTQTITGTVALLTCQSNRFVDNSPTPKTITTGGSPSVVAFSPFAPTAAYTTAAVGGSGYFDGTGDYLTWAGSSVGSGAFTFECWFYYTGTFAGTSAFIGPGTATTNALSIQISSSTTIQIDQYGVTATSFTVPTMTANQWYHLAVVRNSGGSCTVFLNGTRSSTGALSITTNFANVAAIGYVSSAVARHWIGYLAGVNYNSTALYDPTLSTITIPTAPTTAVSGTQLLLNFTNAGITDATAKNDLETVGNAQISTSVSKFGGGSIAFDGTGDGLVSNATIGATAFGTGDFTIEFWAYITNTGVAQATIVDSRAFGSTSTTNQIYMLYTSTNNISFFTNGAYRINSSAITQNTWNHVALVRSSGSTKMYLNGVQTGSTYADTNNYAGNANRPVIGLDASDLSTFGFPGNIDDFRITRGYARYTSNFTPPTAPFPVQ